MQGYIYIISDPITNNVKYIGQTINPKLRFIKHISDSRHCDNKIRTWINGSLKKGLTPKFEIIDICEINDLDFWEKHYISLFSSWGFQLKNMTLGGFRNKQFSIETRNKISNSLKGKKQSEETKKKRSESLKKAYENIELRQLKSRQTSELNKKGIIGTKGKPSNKKGKPFSGDKEKLSNSLKEYYKTNKPHNYKNIDEAIINKIRYDYNLGINKFKLHKKYNLNRKIIDRLL